MVTIQLNCRNFACRFNRAGECKLERITLTPQGNIIDHVRCVDAAERTPGDAPPDTATSAPPVLPGPYGEKGG